MPHRVFLDSNILASRTLRDWVLLCRLRTGDMFQLHTTLDVIAETIRAVRSQHPQADGGVITEIDRKIREVVDELIDDFPGDVEFARGAMSTTDMSTPPRRMVRRTFW